MALIEGIGDEVIHFFILLAIVLIALVAWWSTNISERPLLRTVLILERRGTRHPTTDNQALNLRDTAEVAPETNETEAEEKNSQSVSDTNNQFEMSVVDNIFVNREEIQSTITDLEEVPKPSCPSSEDMEETADDNSKNESSVVRNRRIAFFKNKEECTEGQPPVQHSKNATDESSTSNLYETPTSEEGNIRIRLKYLNDDLKLVEGKLQEQLGDFKRFSFSFLTMTAANKVVETSASMCNLTTLCYNEISNVLILMSFSRRHFSLELAGRKLVRLIFNGKVLQQDTKTLQNYGFFDNCVVHCLVHQPRTPPPSPNLNRHRSDATTQNETVHHWDLGNILFASLSVLLCLAWYGRYQYAQLYTATTTVALIGLTGMFTVSLIGMYMPDVDGIRTH